VVRVGSFAFTLDGPRTGGYELELGRHVLSAIVKDGPRPLAARFPGARLIPGEVRALRGVTIARWDDGTREILASLDVATVCVVLEGEASGTPPGTLPRLPAALRRLVLARGYPDCRPLRSLPDLLLLSVESPCSPAHLALAGLTRLRNLELRVSHRIRDLEFVRPLRSLRSLTVDYTLVTDLSPAATLPHLRHLRVRGFRGTGLPEGGFAALRRADLLYGLVSDGDLDAFGRAHPACALLRRVDEILRAAVAGTDTVRVLTGYGRFAANRRRRLVAVVVDSGEILEFLAALRSEDICPVRVSPDGLYGQFGGLAVIPSHTLEFRRGPDLLAAVGWFRGGLRWPEGAGDVRLTPGSARLVEGWLARRGVPEAVEAVESREER
jgi:hypothetical protein